MSGRTLSSSPPPRSPLLASKTTSALVNGDLLPEPPTDQKKNVCTVQIRTSHSGSGRRRFDITKANMSDLFQFASALTNVAGFRLVPRFPRKVFENNADMTMKEAGQESLMVGFI